MSHTPTIMKLETQTARNLSVYAMPSTLLVRPFSMKQSPQLHSNAINYSQSPLLVV
ncbi:unnamed protein product [Fusarium graminearum]|uniref:Chromosome 4, complete genome n=1 Tax=Gibberella zeae (strain ATCC MYA-4620 / CBS 123657 / FGSC 9075 / NRRL 31084 / PH-1) TaxID=229533 RepID=A0A098DWN9_GIBZE|nr:unnamed protein product [Fusarium graminearum]CZS74575.1 unnamed protein product [Fusarium graminearum]